MLKSSLTYFNSSWAFIDYEYEPSIEIYIHIIIYILYININIRKKIKVKKERKPKRRHACEGAEKYVNSHMVLARIP